MESVNKFLEVAPTVFMVVSIVATIAARLIPNKATQEKVDGIAGAIVKIIQFLPTIGVNPKTKALEEAYKNLSQDNKKSDE